VRAEARASSTPLIAAWMDAARREVFTSLFSFEEDGGLTCVDEPAVASPGATIARWSALVEQRGVLFAGDGAVRYEPAIRAALGPRGRIVTPVPLLAGVIAELAEAAASRGLAGPPHALRPLYVRRPDAELARDRTHTAPTPSGS